MTENKLYELSYLEKEGESLKQLSYSHSLKKLSSSVFIPGNHWNVNNGSSGYVKATQTDIYPVYYIYEVNFII